MELNPIHKAISPTTAKMEEPVGQEFYVVCYNKTRHPTNATSTTQLLSLSSDTELAKDSNCVGHGNLDSGIASSGSPPNTCKGQSVSFFT